MIARLHTLTVVLLCSLFTACAGGSGSSGFDQIENAVIQRVVEGRECEDLNGLTICPVDTLQPQVPTPSPQPATPTRTPSPDGSPIPTPPAPSSATPDKSVNPTMTPTEAVVQTSTQTVSPSPTATMLPGVLLAPTFGQLGDARVCQPIVDTGSCQLSFDFIASGFPFDTTYLVAAREVGLELPWTIVRAEEILRDGKLQFQRAVIPFDLAATGDAALVDGVQLVVLTFMNNRGPVPSQVDQLADTAPDSAFAVTPFTVTLE